MVWLAPSLYWGNVGPGARLARASVPAERGILHPAPADAGEIVARIARAQRPALRGIPHSHVGGISNWLSVREPGSTSGGTVTLAGGVGGSSTLIMLEEDRPW